MTASATEKGMDETGEIVEKITVRVGRFEIERMDRLIEVPEFKFRTRENFIRSALLGFLNLKERELQAIRRGERWWR